MRYMCMYDVYKRERERDTYDIYIQASSPFTCTTYCGSIAMRVHSVFAMRYGATTSCRLHRLSDLFCERAVQKWGTFPKETWQSMSLLNQPWQIMVTPYMICCSLAIYWHVHTWQETASYTAVDWEDEYSACWQHLASASQDTCAMSHSHRTYHQIGVS